MLVLLAVTQSTTAQPLTNWCGTVGHRHHGIVPRLEANKAALAEGTLLNRSVTYVPIKFHIIGRSDGTGEVATWRVLDQLCMLNEDYAATNIQFYLKDGLNYIFSDDLFDNHSNVTNLMELERDDAALNVFMPDDATPPGQTGPGLVLGYYSPSDDWVVVDRSEVGRKNLTFTHEIGHFFSLLHPFSGWEEEPWSIALHGNPVTQIRAPDGMTFVELVDRSNCDIAGDRVCDTPPDYLFGFGWNSCDFNAAIADRNGQVIDPDELLWMGYFFNCDADDYYFTAQQVQLQQQDLASASRAYLRTGVTPNLTAPEGSATPLFPEEGEEVRFFNAVTLSWEAVPEAEAYLLQVSLLPTFSSALISYEAVVEGTSTTITSLDSTRVYYWRLRPFGDYQTCTDFGPSQSFRTGDQRSTQGNGAISAFELARSPLRRGEPLNLSIQATRSFAGRLQLYAANGQVVREYGELQLVPGSSTWSLPASLMETGVYYIVLQTPDGPLVRPIIITY